MADEIKKSIKIEVDGKDLTALANSIDLFNAKFKNTIIDVNGNTTTLMTNLADSINFLKTSLDQYETNASNKALNRLNIYKQIETVYKAMKDLDPIHDTKVKESAEAINKSINKSTEAYSKQLSDISFLGTLFKPGQAFTMPTLSSITSGAYETIRQSQGARISYLEKVKSSYDPRIEELSKKENLTEAEKTQLSQLQGERSQADAAFQAAKSASVWTAIIASIVQTLIKGVQKTVETFSEISGITLSIKKNFDETVSTSKDLLQSALTANQATSLFSDAASRTRQLIYGLSASQSYAMGQTMSMLGMKSEEDLLFMNSTQAELFNEFMRKYEGFYSKLESSGTLESIQEMQLEFKLMRQEIAMDLLEWLSKNKDTILGAAKSWLKVSEVLLTVLMDIGKFFGSSFSGALSGLGYEAIASSDAVAVSSTLANRTVVQNVTLTMNNSAELANSDNELKTFFNDQGEQLIKQLAIQLGES